MPANPPATMNPGTKPCASAACGQRVTRATCPYCGVGCVVDLRVEGNAMRSIHADASAAPNFGMLCPKGALLFKTDAGARRLTTPMVRDRKGGPLRPTGWDEALDRIASGIGQTLAWRGPDAVAWYGSGQLDTEASYLFTKLFKGYLGSNHTDTNSRLCMSSAVAGYVHSFGSDGPPTCYEDFEHAHTFFLLGANMTANHPVLFNRVRRRRATHAGARVIVVDPRRTKTAELADLHLAVRPGGDVALLRLIARQLMLNGAVDHGYVVAHTSGFELLKRQLEELDVDAATAACGIPSEQVALAAEWMGGRSKGAGAVDEDRRLLSCYCMGANQSSHGTDKNTALIDLHLMLGQVGKPGAGPFSLTGQPNAMGGREVGYLSHQLPGYRRVDRATDRMTVETAWGLPCGSISSKPGRSAVAMFDAAARCELGVLWVACTNPAVSMPELDVAQHGLRETPLVIVQDCLRDTETAAYADVLLPAATWGEKDGTMTNSERLVTRSRAGLTPPIDALPDWQIVARVAHRLGLPGFDHEDADAVWDEFRELTRDTLCDMSGLTNERLAAGGTHWPCPEADGPAQTRRYTDGVFPTDDGRARFGTARYQPPVEATDDDYPLVVTTGRVASQWHTRGRTGVVPELDQQEPEPFVQVHPRDAAAARVEDGMLARVVSRRGASLARVRVTEDVPAGVVFLPFHWGDTFGPQTAANYVTHRRVDLASKQPELKHAVARLEPTGLVAFPAATDPAGVSH